MMSNESVSANGRVDRSVRRQARYTWLLKKALEKGFLDVLDSELVDAYIANFDQKYTPTNWGAHKCRRLGADLSAMAKGGFLNRRRIGLCGGAWQPGFPKWVWSYEPICANGLTPNKE